MDKISIAVLIAIGLFVGIMFLMEVGRRIGARQLARDPDGVRTGTGTVEGAIFALVGLLIAFTFSGAATRFDERRALIVQETNAIGTAWLRLDLLAEPARSALREDFRHYVDARLAAYRRIPDMPRVMAALQEATELQARIWNGALAAGRAADAAPDAVKLLVPALNEMIDITTTRTKATEMHPPAVVYMMLVVLTLAASLLAGYGMAGTRSRNWLHITGFAAVMAMAIYIIIDMEYPRLGLIRVDAFDQALVDLRAGM